MIDIHAVQAEWIHARGARVALEAAESEIEMLVHDMQSPAWPRVSLVDALLDETYDPHLFKRSH